MPAVVAANDRWMVEAIFEPTSVRITFANGDRFRFPLEPPWDLVRAEWDPDFAEHVRASEDATVAVVGRKMAEVRRVGGLSQALSSDAHASRAPP
jgi:hypothetical protein